MKFEARLPLACFAARTRDEAVLKASSSGGVFTELARRVLSEGGVVAGAAWNRKTWQVEHRVVRSESELADLRGAKYVYSRFAGVFGELEACLADGRPVLFSGVPCQIAAARRRLHDAEGLLTCGVICHSGVDEKIWLRYVFELETKAKSRLMDVSFRDKSRGWGLGRSQMVVKFENPHRNFTMPMAQCPYIRAFLSGYAAREICLSCRYRAGRAGMDILLGDFWGIEKHLPGWADRRGTSAVMVYSKRGLAAINAIDCQKTLVEYASILDGNPMLEECVDPNWKARKKFLETYEKCGVTSAYRRISEGPWAWRIWLSLGRRIGRAIRKGLAGGRTRA